MFFELLMAHDDVNLCSQELIMQTKCELNIPDLVKLGHSERAALGTRISVSRLQCARLGMIQLLRHASNLPL